MINKKSNAVTHVINNMNSKAMNNPIAAINAGNGPVRLDGGVSSPVENSMKNISAFKAPVSGTSSGVNPTTGNGIAGGKAPAGGSANQNPASVLRQGNGLVRLDGGNGINAGASGGSNPLQKSLNNIRNFSFGTSDAPRANVRVVPGQYGGVNGSDSELYNQNGNLLARPADSVQVTGYLNNVPNAHASWDTSQGELYINGINIPKNQVFLSDDGRAYVSKSVLDKVYENSVKNNPYSLNSRLGELDAGRERLLDEIENIRNYDKFSYDYRSDPLFAIYEKYYDELGDAAVKDALAQMTSRTGGYLNSNALAAAYQMRNKFDSHKANIIPTLEKQAYDRWYSERELDGTLTGDLLNNIANYDIAKADVYSDEMNRDLERDDSVRANERAWFEMHSNNSLGNAELALRDKELEATIGLSYAELEQKAMQFAQSMGIDWARLDLEERALILDNEYKYAALNKKYNGSYKRSSTKSGSGGSTGAAVTGTSSGGSAMSFN